MGFWRNLKKQIKQQWASFIGMLASIMGYVYGFFSGGSIRLAGQSGVATTEPSYIVLPLTLLFLILFAASLSWYIYAVRKGAK